MAVTIRPTSTPVGVFVSGIDFENLSRADASRLYQAFLKHGVLVFKDMDLGVQEHVQLAGLFGEMGDPHPLEELRHPEQPRLSVLAANGGRAVPDDAPDADQIVGAIPWHADKMYTPDPNRGALLRAAVRPAEGGLTGWIDTSRVYEKLPYRIKCKIQGLHIVHSYDVAHRAQSMVAGGAGQFPDTIHPLIIVHPESDRPALNLSPVSAARIVGLPADEAADLLDYLIEVGTDEADAYVHDWEPGDLVAWDNLRTIHRAFGHKKRFPRVMHSMALKPEFTLGRYSAEVEAAERVLRARDS
jgi:alpha-ketoglutarate-dependent taurine dioxygenase